MPANVLPLNAAPYALKPSASSVWDRVWQHQASDARDDALLVREECSHRWDLIIARLEATFGGIEGLRTIELGSGRGDLSALLAQRGARVSLLDTSDTALDQARRRFERLGLTANYVHADMFAALGTDALPFDVALSSGVIEHFQGHARTRAVRAHYTCIGAGGLVIISVPNAWCVPYRLWKTYLELRGWWPYGLEQPYNTRELVRRAKAVGFSRVEVHTFGFWQSISSHWAQSLLHRNLDWANRPSFLDSTLGSTLLLFGWRDGAPARSVKTSNH